jgi:hypothetical protein
VPFVTVPQSVIADPFQVAVMVPAPALAAIDTMPIRLLPAVVLPDIVQVVPAPETVVTPASPSCATCADTALGQSTSASAVAMSSLETRRIDGYPTFDLKPLQEMVNVVVAPLAS